MKNSDNILRVGEVDTGRIFQFGHTRTYPQFVDKAWLPGSYDLSPARAEAARQQYVGLLEAHAEAHPEQA